MYIPRKVDLSVQFATTEAFRAMITLGVRALHFSGHGSPKCFYFEDGIGTVHPVSYEHLKLLCDVRPQLPLRLVVVQSCYSEHASAFVSCGIPHVISINIGKRLEDTAAIVFTKYVRRNMMIILLNVLWTF
jgi:hypothetical protein